MKDYFERPGEDEYASYYAPYVARVPAEGGLIEILESGVRETRELLNGLSEEEADFAYAPGKWTVGEVVGHLIDAERVFSYRALRFGRGDPTELAGFEENLYVSAGGFRGRSLEELLDEFEVVRRGTILLLGTMPAEGWTRRGMASGYEVSVRALACITAGHEAHRRSILEKLYLSAGA